jgi:hypothetical protein
MEQAVTLKTIGIRVFFLGAGYRSGNATIGARYNVNDTNNIYGSAFMPFVGSIFKKNNRT